MSNCLGLVKIKTDKKVSHGMCVSLKESHYVRFTAKSEGPTKLTDP